MQHPSEHAIRRYWRKIWDPMDMWLFYSMLAIYVMSLFLLYSADGQSIGQLENKTLHTIVGFVLLWCIARTRPQVLSNFAIVLYGVSLLMHETDLGWRHYLAALVLIAVPGFLILKQPDLGTAVLIMASGLFVIFFAGLPWRVIAVAVVGFFASLPLLWQYGMHDYQRTRVLTLLDPTKDPLGAGYHILQSMTAIGSGGVWGKGWLNGTQTHLDYIPESTTDFIFAVYGEEFGLIGNILLLTVYTIMLGRGLYIAAKAPTLYSRTLAGALTMTLFCYVFVNMGMVSGILPVVGVPLPLVSYGGTATLSIMIIVAMLMGISNQQSKM